LTPESDEKFRIWDSYWQDNRLNWEVLDTDPDVEAAIKQHWSYFAEALPDGARVLDLACGKGYVGVTLMRAAQGLGKDVSVVAIDAADIDPGRYLNRHKAIVSEIEYHGRT